MSKWAEAPEGFVRDPGTGELYVEDELDYIDPLVKERIERAERERDLAEYREVTEFAADETDPYGLNEED